MGHDRLFALTSDDLARMEHRARKVCEGSRNDTNAYRLAVDVLRLLEERARLILPADSEGQGHAR